MVFIRKLAALLIGILSSLNVLADEEIRPVLIGFDGAYSVKNSTSATAIELGMRAAIKEVNEAGGVLGGRPLKYLKMDNHSVPARGVSNLRNFVHTRDLVAVFGGRFSPVQLAQVDVAHQLGMPFINVWGAANGITDHNHSPSYTFRVSLKDEWAMPAMLEEVKRMGKKRIGVMLPLNGWGRSNEKSLNAARADYPEVEVVAVTWHHWGDRSILPKYEELLLKGVEVVIMVVNDNETIVLLTELADNPDITRLPMVSHWGITGGDMMKTTSDIISEVDFRFVQTFSFFNLPQSRQESFMQTLTSVSGITSIEEIESPVGLAHAYDAVHLLALAIEQAGTTERQAIRDALESGIRFEGLVKNYAPAFTADDHEALSADEVFFARYNEKGLIIPLAR